MTYDNANCSGAEQPATGAELEITIDFRAGFSPAALSERRQNSQRGLPRFNTATHSRNRRCVQILILSRAFCRPSDATQNRQLKIAEGLLANA